MARKPSGTPSPREAGLRKLAAGGHGRAEARLQQAIVDLQRSASAAGKGADLRTLVSDIVESFPDGIDPDQRGKAVWRLIRDEVGRMPLADERTAVTAALHLDPTNRESSIDKRLAFARDRGDFGSHASGRPYGYDALRQWWGDGVRSLGHAIGSRVAELRENPEEWRAYFIGAERRTPFKGAQPVFADLFVTTVFMQGRTVRRRVTDRLVTAQDDGVRNYAAWALPEGTDTSKSVPVRALWGCRAEQVSSSPGEPTLTMLWFPRPLKRGEKHYFSSEVVAEKVVVGERRAINVEIDHHGIAPGQRIHDSVPVSGLTIRVSFDVDDLPSAVWWYADVPEMERYVRPRADDGRLLEVTSQGYAEHTFAEACVPRANYGVAFAWPVA